jgi:hypothetical protein
VELTIQQETELAVQQACQKLSHRARQQRAWSETANRVRLVPFRQFLFQPGAPAARNPKDLRYFPFRYLLPKINILLAIYKKKELRPNDTARILRSVLEPP